MHKAVCGGKRRHPTVGDDCIVGEEIGWFGIIYVDFGWYMLKAVCWGKRRHLTVGDNCIVGEDFGWFGVICPDFGWICPTCGP
jgi:hypothetical protein